MASGSAPVMMSRSISESIGDDVNLLSNSSNYLKVEGIAATAASSSSRKTSRQPVQVDTKSGPFAARKRAQKGEVSPLTPKDGTQSNTIAAVLAPSGERAVSMNDSIGAISTSESQPNKGGNGTKGASADNSSVRNLNVANSSSGRPLMLPPDSRQPTTSSIVTVDQPRKPELSRTPSPQSAFEGTLRKIHSADLDSVSKVNSDGSFKEDKYPSATHDPSSNSSRL